MIALPASPAHAASTSGPTLRDIHLPPQPSWWPPAPGWWMLAALGLMLLIVAIWAWRRRRQTSGQRQRVLAEIDQLAAEYQRDSDPAALAAGLHQLLRRVARRHDPSAGQQTGAAWRKTLARVPVDAAIIDRLLQLDELMYRATPTFDHKAAISAVRSWVRLALKRNVWKPLKTESADA
jgi:hypothetical protein